MVGCRGDDETGMKERAVKWKERESEGGSEGGKWGEKERDRGRRQGMKSSRLEKVQQ